MEKHVWQSDSIGSGSVAVSKYTDAIVQDGVAWDHIRQ
mgnify:CR=1 FL=1